jgi:cell division protein FtsB
VRGAPGAVAAKKPVSKARSSARRPPRPAAGARPIARARLALLGAVVASAVVLVAWFPATSLLSQHSTLAEDQAQLSSLHKQDAALAQEKKNLSDPSEIGRVAREQYQLVSPGQQAYEVLPPSGATAAGTPYAGDPGSKGPVAPSATSELPPGGVTTTTSPAPSPSRTGSSSSASASANAQAAGGGGGLLSRMVHSLEFWR